MRMCECAYVRVCVCVDVFVSWGQASVGVGHEACALLANSNAWPPRCFEVEFTPLYALTPHPTSRPSRCTSS